MPKSKSRKRSTRRPYVPVAPTPAAPKASPSWFGYLVVGFILVGVALIVLNYMSILPPGRTIQAWLWAGLGCIGAGFALSTRWKDRKSTRLNSSHIPLSRMPSSA